MSAFRFLICLFAIGTAATSCRAGIVITFEEVGNDVVESGSGTANLAGLQPFGDGGSMGTVESLVASTAVGETGLNTVYWGITGPSSFGTGLNTFASSNTGQTFGINFNVATQGIISLPLGYVSGSNLAGTSTYSNASFASLGLATGTYGYTWGSGADADFLTVKIIPSAVPEPSSFALAGLAMACTGLAGHLRRKPAAA